MSKSAARFPKGTQFRYEFLLLVETIMIFVIVGVFAGSFHEEFFRQEAPCPLCYLQRLSFISVAVGAMMNLRISIKIQHFAFSVLSAIFGQVVSTRQILLHICPGEPKFGIPILGLNLYTWAYIIFACIIFAQIIMLFIYIPEVSHIPHKKMRWWETLATVLVLLVILGNIVSLFIECGMGLCEDNFWPKFFQFHS